MAKFSLRPLNAILDDHKNVKTVLVGMRITHNDGGETNWSFPIDANKETDITEIMDEAIELIKSTE